MTFLLPKLTSEFYLSPPFSSENLRSARDGRRKLTKKKQLDLSLRLLVVSLQLPVDPGVHPLLEARLFGEKARHGDSCSTAALSS